MSEIRTNLLKSERGDASPSAPFGLRVSGVTTTGTLNVTANATISGDVTVSGNLGVAGTITYEDVARVDATGISTFREGYKVGPLAGIALTAYKDGSIRTTGIITASSFVGSGANLTGIDATKIITGNTQVQTIDTGSDGHVKVLTEGTERFRIDSNGKVLIGTTNVPSNKNTVTPSLNVSGSGVLGAAQITRHTGVGGGGALLHLAGTRGSDVNSYTILQNNDGIGTLAFNAADGNEFVTAAEISAQVDGTPGDNDMPGRLLFKTTADGASSPTERLRISSAGKVSIGNGTSAYLNNDTDGDRTSLKVGNQLHISGGGNSNFRQGIYNNCRGQGQANFYQGTVAASGGDYRASALTMCFGGVQVWNDKSTNTNYAAGAQITGMAQNFEVNDKGYVLSPRNPKFWYSALSNSSTSGATDNAEILKFSTEKHNEGSNYSTSNGRFTAPVAGTYHFSVNLLIDNSSGSTHYSAQIKRNGSALSGSIVYNYATSGHYNWMGGTCCLYLAVNDYVEIYADSSIHDGNESSFAGHLIG